MNTSTSTTITTTATTTAATKIEDNKVVVVSAACGPQRGWQRLQRVGLLLGIVAWMTFKFICHFFAGNVNEQTRPDQTWPVPASAKRSQADNNIRILNFYLAIWTTSATTASKIILYTAFSYILFFPVSFLSLSSTLTRCHIKQNN